MAIITHIITRILQEVGNPTQTLLLTCGVLSIYTVLLKIHKTLKLPPGPFGVPLLGIMPYIKKEFHLTLYDYSRKFGKKIFTN